MWLTLDLIELRIGRKLRVEAAVRTTTTTVENAAARKCRWLTWSVGRITTASSINSNINNNKNQTTTSRSCLNSTPTTPTLIRNRRPSWWPMNVMPTSPISTWTVILLINWISFIQFVANNYCQLFHMTTIQKVAFAVVVFSFFLLLVLLLLLMKPVLTR